MTGMRMLLAFSSVFLQPSLGCRARFHTGARTWMHGRWTPQRPKKRSRPTNFVFAQVHWRPNTTHRHTDDQRQSLSCAKHACATARTRFAVNAHRTFMGEADIRDDGSQEGGDRNAENAKRVYALKLQRFAGPSPSQCSRCWHEIKSCICPTAPSPVAGLFPHRIIIYMHLKEFARGSNTGSLCQVAFPSSTTVHVASVPESEEALAQELVMSPHRTFVLYPAQDSLSVSQYLHRLASLTPPDPVPPLIDSPRAPEPVNPHGHVHPDNLAAAPNLSHCAIEPLTIVLIDGTWNQARRLARKLDPTITRVRIDDSDGDTGFDFDKRYFSPLRRQPGPGRLCTLSAFALLTRQLLVDPRVETYLLDLLHRKSQTFLAAHNKDWKLPL